MWACGCGLNLMIISVSSKAHFHSQNTVDNHTNEIDHQNNGTCGCVAEEGESVSYDSETEEQVEIHMKSMQQTFNLITLILNQSFMLIRPVGRGGSRGVHPIDLQMILYTPLNCTF